MISISEAISAVKNQRKPLTVKCIKPVEKAGGYLLFEDIKSPINMPPFRQSAMDGYALNLHDKISYKLIGEIKAGDAVRLKLNPGEAVRIFTGAAVPDSANAVMMQEKVQNHGETIDIQHQIDLELNIRPLGEQVKTGDIALKKGTKLTPAAIGYLLSLGITEVSVYKKPNIALVTTGNELVEPGLALTHGKIYESNSRMLLSALYNLKFYDITLYKVEDDYAQTVSALNSAINDNDLILITGGISVGDYDFVGKALSELHVEELFYKVKQKPGKPLFYGKKEDTQIFALPGNPAAALSCFYVYVYIALQNLMGRNDTELPRAQATSTSVFKKRGDRPQFLKAIYQNETVEILEGQNSSMLQTFALSNALVHMPGEVSEINEGDTVEVIILPQ
ncbi:molybdopterin molybdotransferase MoeA [Tamlana agarivorans]|uniref:Molybdopterin molybdotransferase MoeA n=1 Tax=Pseudotamlana agarivorans TaxID=481183 RepID=A0ACC5UCY0_9FLAO|nr:gephyrin-like molybdotransferase Glp [Tamlana agarivorans]MBU2952060.1 molybdopterin molybdotransferase MoeA [Tamlana agarivorans]